MPRLKRVATLEFNTEAAEKLFEQLQKKLQCDGTGVLRQAIALIDLAVQTEEQGEKVMMGEREITVLPDSPKT
jgi:hypothetical protein